MGILCRGHEGASVLPIVAGPAPVQFPSLLKREQHEMLRREIRDLGKPRVKKLPQRMEHRIKILERLATIYIASIYIASIDSREPSVIPGSRPTQCGLLDIGVSALLKNLLMVGSRFMRG